MAVMLPHVARGNVGEGLSAAVERIGLVLAAHFPKTAADTNELPDRPISL
jgi:putative membrane protein